MAHTDEIEKLREENARLQKELTESKQLNARYKEWVEGHKGQVERLQERIECLEEEEQAYLRLERYFFKLSQYFRSANAIPVDRATIQAEDFWAIYKAATNTRGIDGLPCPREFAKVTDFPLDIEKPRYTLAILYSILANVIATQCEQWKIDPPVELHEFLSKNDKDAGIDWEIKLMKQSETMPLDLLELWVGNMRGGLCRAEMRAVLQNRKAAESTISE